MFKLYKKSEGIIHYWETWDINNKTGIIHWGVVGGKGESINISSESEGDFKIKIQKIIHEKVREGYDEIKDENLYTLMIEYDIDGMGTGDELEKRYRLQDRMHETLGWTGLGYCDGGSIGSGTMEVCCLVVDFDIGKRIVKEDLKGTEFENYASIYNENTN